MPLQSLPVKTARGHLVSNLHIRMVIDESLPLGFIMPPVFQKKAVVALSML
jgi:16S rRNA G1207 methylase RsmC